MAKPNWKRKLPKPLRLDDGTVLRTLDDARRFVVSVPKHQESNFHQIAGQLLEAANGGPLQPMNDALEVRLFYVGALALK